jgi:cell division protein DivIC
MASLTLPKWLRWMRNKYVLTLSFVLVWLLFFDRYDLRTQWQMQRKLKSLEQEEAYYRQEIARNQFKLNALKKDKAYLERFARETYLMKRTDEDVFLIIDSAQAESAKNVKTD